MKVSTTAITALAAASQAAASWTDWVDPDATVTSTVTQTHTYCPCNGEVSYTPVDPDYTDVVVYTTETGADYTDVVVYTTKSGVAVAPAAATTPAGTTVTKAGPIVVVFETEGSTSTKTGMAIELIIAPTGTETETEYVTKTVWTGEQPTNDLEWVDWDDSNEDDGATLTRTHTLVTTLYEAVGAFPTETDTESWADWAATTNTFTVTTETSVTVHPSSSGNAVGPIGGSMSSSTSSSASSSSNGVGPIFGNTTSTSSSSTSVLAPISANTTTTSSSSSSSITSSTTTSSTSTATTVAAGQTIIITANLDSTKKNKRDTYYVGIDNSIAVLGSQAGEATFITGEDGTILYGAEYLGSNPTSDEAAALLEVFTSVPTDSVWLMDASGALTLSQRQFCVLPSLRIETVDAAGDNCDGTIVTFTAVSATTSTTSSSSTGSTSVLAPVSATTTSITSTTSSKTSSSSSSSTSTSTSTTSSTTSSSSSSSTTTSTSTTSSKTSSSSSSSTTTSTSTKSTTTTTTTTTSSGSLPTETDNVTGDDYQTGILFAHNVHRANHSASDLTWNADMATYAAQTAATCNYQHNRTAGGGNYGQNIGAGYTSTHVPIMIGNDMYNAEMPNYPTPYGTNDPDTSNFGNWGHFSQIVWKATTGVGCATQYCDTLQGATFTKYFTVCNYYPAGNVGGEYSNVGAPLGQDVVVIEVDD